MIGGQGEDSCGKSGTGETPQERKRSLAWKSTALSQAVSAHVSHLFIFRLDLIFVLS
ncbi:hypothetical protein [Priestia aryabhattai]|uniref:hypothetical protein n=1 Tax=Priestia aryabhattai TaxID=412384 RepID=UPI0014837150|nr:hypothetical protein [Priestia aryabhattai]